MASDLYRPLFPYIENKEQFSLLAYAGFHIGLPLGLYQSAKGEGWAGIKKELAAGFSSNSALFEVVDPMYDPETRFPLGEPLVLRSNNFFEIFNLRQIFEDENIQVLKPEHKLDNLIWICPSGVVLIM